MGLDLTNCSGNAMGQNIHQNCVVQIFKATDAAGYTVELYLCAYCQQVIWDWHRVEPPR